MFRRHLKISICLVFLIFAFLNKAAAENNFFHQDLLESAKNSAKIRYEKFDERGVYIENAILQLKQKKSPSHLQTRHTLNTKNLSELSKNKVNVVIIGDGYTRDELPLFRQQVNEKVSELFAEKPLSEYKSYFNVIVIESVSSKSGIADSEADSSNTAFGMYFNCAGLERLICIDLNKVYEAVRQIPKIDMIFALANTDKYGGAGYLKPAIATLSAGHKLSTELALHEFGHAFGKLTDEYEDEDHNTDCDSYPNASSIDSHQMKAEKKKWHAWLHLNHIGTFSGGCYNKKIFRPTEVSKMRSLKNPFHEVNSEEIIKQIYRKTKLIESAELIKKQNGRFEVLIETKQNISGTVKVKWFLNELELSEFENKTRIQSNTLNFDRENFILTAIVKDESRSVTDEEFRSSHMIDKIQWEIKSPLQIKN